MSVFSFFKEACSSCSLTNTSTNNCLEIFQPSNDLVSLCLSACEEMDQLERITAFIVSAVVFAFFLGWSTQKPQKNPFEFWVKIPVFPNDNHGATDSLSMQHG